VAPITFSCPACSNPLKFEARQTGDLYECPRCGARGILSGPTPNTAPAAAVTPVDEAPKPVPRPDDMPLLGERPPAPTAAVPADVRLPAAPQPREERRHVRRWVWVRRGLQMLLLSWLVVCVVSALLVLMMFYYCVQIFFRGETLPVEGSLLAVLGLIIVLTEFITLGGYVLCLRIPGREGLRAWVWQALAAAALRNLACLQACVFLFVAEVDSRAVTWSTGAAALLFFGQWISNTLLLRALADALKEFWLLHMAWTDIFLSSLTAAGWAVLFCVLFNVGLRAHADVTTELTTISVRIVVGLGGMAFSALLAWALFWHLRTLYFVTAVVAVQKTAPRSVID
jgi:hypothetical protein